MTHTGARGRTRTIASRILEGFRWLGFFGPCGASAYAAASDRRSNDEPSDRELSLNDELWMLGLDVFPHDDER